MRTRTGNILKTTPGVACLESLFIDKNSVVDIKGTTVRTLKLKAGLTSTSIYTKDLRVGAYYIIFEKGALKETTQFIKE